MGNVDEVDKVDRVYKVKKFQVENELRIS